MWMTARAGRLSHLAERAYSPSVLENSVTPQRPPFLLGAPLLAIGVVFIPPKPAPRSAL